MCDKCVVTEWAKIRQETNPQAAVVWGLVQRYGSLQHLESADEETTVDQALEMALDDYQALPVHRQLEMFELLAPRRLGPLKPGRRDRMLMRMYESGVELEIHPDDTDRGFGGAGINEGFRAYTKIDGETRLFYVKDNKQVENAEAEVAAFFLSELWGLKMVPYVFRHGVITFHEWVEDAVVWADADGVRTSPVHHNRMDWFDYIVGNTDRHKRNYMVREHNGELVAIDHGFAFQSDYYRGAPAQEPPVELLELSPEVVLDFARDFPNLNIKSVVARLRRAQANVPRQLTFVGFELLRERNSSPESESDVYSGTPESFDENEEEDEYS